VGHGQSALEDLGAKSDDGGARMKILVTGNMGYVGPCVVRHLRHTVPDVRLIGYDLGLFGHCITDVRFLPEALLDIQYFGDVRKFDPSLLDGVDAIVHLAAVSNDPIGNHYEQVTLDINYGASAALARTAKSRGVRHFVFASSCSVYGAAADDARTEQDEVHPLTAYARSKVQSELALAALADDTFTVTCLRFATACGMSSRLRLDLVLNDFVASAVGCGEITILSDGTPWRPLISVGDMARAIEWAIGRDADNGGNFLVVNTGSNRWNFRVRDLAEAVANLIPGTRVSINPDAQPDKRSYRVDFSRFAALAPHHQPIAELAHAILEIRDGLRGMGFCDRQFRNSSLMRLNAISELRNCGLLTAHLEWTHRPPALTTIGTALGTGIAAN
jgi:nucleoside-diphosphate-sugar epimerase